MIQHFQRGNGNCKIFQLDNDREFINQLLKHISIKEVIDYHINRRLKTKGYKPSELKDTKDENIINEVI